MIILAQKEIQSIDQIIGTLYSVTKLALGRVALCMANGYITGATAP